MSVAVTGATGKLGGAVVGELLKVRAPDSIVALVRDPARAADLKARGVQVRAAPYEDREALRTALDGVSALLLVSGSEVAARVSQHRNVIDAAKAAGVGRLAYTSIAKAETSTNPLAPDHKATEAYLRASGVPFTMLRDNWYTENYYPNIEQARRTGTVVAAAGKGKVASATRADYAAGAAAVLTTEGHEGKVYEFSGDHAWDFDELADAISQVIRMPVRYEAVTSETLMERLEAQGLAAATARFVAAMDQSIEAGDLAAVSPDLSRLVGRPTTPLLEALRAGA